MTAQTVPAIVASRPADRPLAGLGTLFRKDTTEWLRGRRAWVVAGVSTAFMALTAANGWIVSRIAERLPEGATVQAFSLDPLDNLLAAVGAQVFVLAAILAVASLIVSERQAGTLAWVASKPVSRRAVWLSKWLSATAMLAVTAVLVPLAATVVVVVALYGAPAPGAIVGLAAGSVAMVAFFTTVGIAAGTRLPGVTGVAATGIVVFALLPAIGGLLPAELAALLPTSILTWAAGLGMGGPVGVATPIAFAVVVAAVAALGLRSMDRLEL
jgi:ABC-type transport system involved in multi-copper enzyme maturation permease subunit